MIDVLLPVAGLGTRVLGWHAHKHFLPVPEPTETESGKFHARLRPLFAYAIDLVEAAGAQASFVVDELHRSCYELHLPISSTPPVGGPYVRLLSFPGVSLSTAQTIWEGLMRTEAEDIALVFPDAVVGPKEAIGHLYDAYRGFGGEPVAGVWPSRANILDRVYPDADGRIRRVDRHTDRPGFAPHKIEGWGMILANRRDWIRAFVEVGHDLQRIVGALAPHRVEMPQPRYYYDLGDRVRYISYFRMYSSPKVLQIEEERRRNRASS
jgi:hypothetical protein